jgi:hypothetical protein
MATSVDTLETPICEAPVQAQMFEATIEKPFTGQMETYHYAWLTAHPDRTRAWLKARLRDGFHVHHVDGNHQNDAPKNLVLMEGVDHLRLHGHRLTDGIAQWRIRSSKRAKEAKAARAAIKAEAVARIVPKRKPQLTPMMIDIVRQCLDGGGSVANAASELGDHSDLSWKQRQSAIKREVLGRRLVY